MKKYYLVVISFILLCSNNFLWAQQEKPIKISALIGDTLDLVERDFYELFPSIEGFQYAIYTLSNDSLIKVKVFYLSEGELRDTINITGITSLDNIRDHVKKIDEEFQQNEMGQKISIMKLNGESIEAELVSVRPNSIIYIPYYQPSYTLEDYIAFLEINKFSELKSITIINESDFTSSCLRIGGLATLGVIIGGALAQGASSGAFKAAAAGIAVTIFIAAGIIGGILWEILATNDEEIEMDKDFDYKSLKPYARFNRFEPEYLRSIHH